MCADRDQHYVVPRVQLSRTPRSQKVDAAPEFLISRQLFTAMASSQGTAAEQDSYAKNGKTSDFTSEFAEPVFEQHLWQVQAQSPAQ